MSEFDDLQLAWWANNLDELDREIVRLALLCDVKLLEPGVIERVIHKDASVCGTENTLAFAKLHNLVMMHFAMHKKSVDAVGPLRTAQIETHIIERLQKQFGERQS